MSAISNAGLLAFLVVSVGVGVRLLALARRTRSLPELLIGASFVIGGCLGFVPEVLAVDGHLPPAVTPVVLVAANGAIRVAAVLTVLFTWRVFRPAEPWAAAVAAGVAILLGIAYLAFPAPWLHASTPAEWWWSLLTACVRAFAFVWASFESLRYWRISRRRAALGLVGPETTRRFLYWGAAIGAVAAMALVPILYRLLPGAASDSTWTLVQSGLGVWAAVAMQRTFARAPAPRAVPAGRLR